MSFPSQKDYFYLQWCKKCEHLHLTARQFVEKDTVRNSNKNLVKAWKHIHHLPSVHQASSPSKKITIAKVGLLLDKPILTGTRIGCPRKLWMPHFWRHSRSGWIGPWTNCSSGWQSCPTAGDWNKMTLRSPSKLSHSDFIICWLSSCHCLSSYLMFSHHDCHLMHPLCTTLFPLLQWKIPTQGFSCTSPHSPLLPSPSYF